MQQNIVIVPLQKTNKRIGQENANCQPVSIEKNAEIASWKDVVLLLKKINNWQINATYRKCDRQS